MKKIVLLLLLPISVFSQSPSLETEERIRKVENSLAPRIIYGDTIPRWKIEDRMTHSRAKGLSIAIIRDYKIEWAKGYGWADEGEQRKVNTSTRFQAASISKSLNSLGILKLAEKGKLDPEADINNYLTNWKFPYDSVSKNKKINSNNLLSHTAGLGIHGFPGYKRSDALPTVPQILYGVKPANTKVVRSIFEPGKKFQYSGGGTTITQLLLTTITGRKYAEYMQEEVLTPLGMTNSSYQQPPADTSNLATGYYQNGNPVKGKYHVYPEQAAAGLWTTPTDLAKYVIECQLALEGRSQKVLSPAMMKKRLTPYIDTAAALGVFIENRGGTKFFSHNGGNEAFLCTSYGSMENGNGVVIMINGEDFGVVSELLNSVAQVYGWKGFYKPEFRKLVTVPADSLHLYVGNYLMMKDTLTIKFCGADLCLQQNGEPQTGYKMLFADNNSFNIGEEPSANFKMIRNTAGNIEALELKQNGVILRLPKLN
ncbi:MAG: serine hydrolase [Ferruginibacter sp.]|nr:serine hydrolase [Chitinophagaceae bacterium]